jgi:hypothetical protein
MTGLAQGAKIIFVVSAAVIERDNMMDFIGGDMNSTFQAILAERVFGEVKTSNLTPTVVVVLGVTMKSVVLAVDMGLVQRAVAFTTNVIGTTAVSTVFKRLFEDILIHE